MSLAQLPVRAQIAVSDLTRARAFYEERLGLVPENDGPDEYRIYPCGGDTALHLYVSRANAGTASGTVAVWNVPDVETEVDELTARGVVFERYDEPATDAKGIHSAGYVTVAWFKDPDGNTFAIER